MKVWLSLGFIIWLGVAGLMPFPAAAQEPVPVFEAFPVAEIYRGATAPLDLADNPAAQAYHTHLTQAAREKPNFAGHYIIANWGCGAACVQTAILDAQTGQVFMLPFYVCCWNGIEDPLEFRLDSSLLVIRGGAMSSCPKRSITTTGTMVSLSCFTRWNCPRPLSWTNQAGLTTQ